MLLNYNSLIISFVSYIIIEVIFIIEVILTIEAFLTTEAADLIKKS